jgi:hypothetical protein
LDHALLDTYVFMLRPKGGLYGCEANLYHPFTTSI